MIIWLDAHLSPAIALWINERFTNCEAKSLRALGLRDANDREIFEAAKKAGAIVMTKDMDFVNLVRNGDTPPPVIWITCGNTSNQRMKKVLESSLMEVLKLIGEGEAIVEIADDQGASSEWVSQ
jgi:predicted nuclease of predicted toxin-antitoxin system